MTKTQIVEAVSSITGLSKAVVARVIDCYHEVVSGGLKKQEKITVAGFGTFSVGHRKARIGRNPRTGQTITIPSTKVAKFKASPGLMKRIKQA
jgi:DNA-binding protein HU-beta